MRPFILTFLNVFIMSLALGQVADPAVEKKSKGSIYVTWGYHRDFYTESTIRFVDHKTDNYDFTFYNAKAKDKPDMDHFFSTPISVPQFSVAVGYFFPNKNGWGIELSSDHLKYVVIDNQVMHMTGNIRGVNYDLDTLVVPDFVHYEHTNGNNYHMVNAVKKTDLFQSRNGKQSLSALLKGGAGLLLPKTESIILGRENDGPYIVAGWVVGASVNLRFGFFKYFFLEPAIKGCYADFTGAKLIDAGRAKQHFFSVQYLASAGFTFPL